MNWNWYFDIMASRKYWDATGRASRQEFWVFVLFYIVFAFVVAFFWTASGISEAGVEQILNLYLLGHLVPHLAVGARRLHDTGRSGWWLLLNLVPLIGPLALLVYFSQPSDPGPNEYGPEPRVQTNVAAASAQSRSPGAP